MKKIILLTVLVIQTVLVSAQDRSKQTRISQLFNFDCKFKVGDLQNAQVAGRYFLLSCGIK